MQFSRASIADVLLIKPEVHGDQRGFFLESYHQEKMLALGLTASFKQDNHSRSAKGVLRGLHYQLQKPQGKLLRVVSGAVFDVAVDIRKGSSTFGQWVGETLSDERHNMMYVPPGFAHGFYVLSDSADVLYKCTDFYDPADEYGIIWNDPQINIKWPGDWFRLSDRDRQASTLSEMMDYLPAYSMPS